MKTKIITRRFTQTRTRIFDSFNISGMDEATLFKCWQMGLVWQGLPGVKNFPSKGRRLGHVTLLNILNPFNIFGMNEATLFKFGKWIDYGKSHHRD